MYKLKERKREREREGERKKPLDGVQLSSISCVCPLNPYAQAQMNPGNVTLSGMPLRDPQHRLKHTHTHTHTHTRPHTHTPRHFPGGTQIISISFQPGFISTDLRVSSSVSMR